MKASSHGGYSKQRNKVRLSAPMKDNPQPEDPPILVGPRPPS
ncbi:hypothetical protein ACPOL_5263 [Acidisarcina polymorpha]|uniref:Uncharacterized protein n=1 Tax=Acidisarcina polymorpha TaxID=2211140 RepID=A0A2Z5G767_9BACT|nr:hypothetical protein ACPOL_5263 [Acidisarcina polymorpha]